MLGCPSAQQKGELISSEEQTVHKELWTPLPSLALLSKDVLFAPPSPPLYKWFIQL